MKPEKQRLLQGLLGNECRRESTLLAGALILRRRRIWRAARQGFVLALVALVATIGLLHQKHRPPPLQAATPASGPAAPAYGQSLTDDQLLALFPDTPVGLATLLDGHKRLIFPRPGDEKRFVTRL